MKNSILVLVILLLFSCNIKKEKQQTELKSESKIKSNTEIKIESGLDKEYSKSAKLFAQEVLKENIRVHVFDITSSENPKHLKIFENDGLEKIEAYSNKKYPKKSNPSYYEHYTLIVATYTNQKKAKITFNRMKSDSKYGLSEWNELEKELSERIRALNIGAKPGGMITQRGKQIFSLVETCRETPMGKNWNEYENKFIAFITENEEEIEVLNANCGTDRYTLEKRKISR